MALIVVDVMPKAEILDPQGKAVTRALARLGHEAVGDVRVGKRFELHVDGPVTDALLATAGILHLTGYSLVDALSPRALPELIDRAHAHGATVTLDPSSTGFIADYGVDPFRAAIAGIDLLRPNLDEGRLLAGLDASAPPAVVFGLLQAGLAIVRGLGRGVAVSPPLTVGDEEIALLAEGLRAGLDSLTVDSPVPAAPGA